MALKRFLGWGSSSLLLVLLLTSSGAQAATLNVVGGILYGASGVDVGGNLYDVEFLDGTCIALFSGCDSAADFTFTTQLDALAASQALLDQVFLDGVQGAFDSDPRLTNGCADSDIEACFSATPYFVSGNGNVDTYVAANRGPSFGANADSVGPSIGSISSDSTASGRAVYSVWTPVPEPGTGLLVGLGLLVMGVRTRRHA